MKLRVLMMAAVAAATATMSTAAGAADYLTYTFSVSGYATRDVQRAVGDEIHLASALNSTIEFIIPTTDMTIGSFSYAAPTLGPVYATDSYTGTITASGFNVVETTRSYTKGPSRSFEINACGAFGGLAVPVMNMAVNPLCSTVNFFRGEPTGQGLAGDGASFRGVVTALTVTAGFGGASSYGLVKAPILALPNPATALPEPASWAMMIVGIGAIGAAARRRRRSPAVAA